ncbi:glycosyltransferase [Chryseobacterium lathyri]|uniref:glycosyltransferase n=1 Tax=Chryseobacterium lathyri TaxID=395933 RepID=UPI00278799EF|nr:glycosyltransferase [Chryseobacterium lathyri]MDQ0066435.1 glycosyltransferase involved in cell wall biosynthesis [Chryseobacterium lathyri]
MKKILVLSTGDINGAYEAMYKVAHIFKNMGHEVVMCVKNKTKTDDFIKPYTHVQLSPVNKNLSLAERAIRKIKAKLIQPQVTVKKTLTTDSKYSFLSKDEITENINVDSLLKSVGFIPDYIFTGMTIDFLNSTDLFNIQQATQAKIYNITVDMNHFTGGCHFSWGCKGYMNTCDDCPAIPDESQKPVAKDNLERKYQNAQKAGFQIIAGSGLTLEQAKKSKIYRNQKTIYNINSLIDTTLLNDQNKSIAKKIFSLEEDHFYILTGAQNMEDPRKGFKYLIEALELLDQQLPEDVKNKINLLVVSNSINKEFDRVTFKKQKIDYIKDYRLLSLLYQATDVFVNSSIEDSGPMMVSEALACGTPVVGFDTGVLTNMVIDDYNGYKIPMKDSHLLAEGIKKIFELDKNQYAVFSKNAVQQVQEFSSYEYAEEIFTKILEQDDQKTL